MSVTSCGTAVSNVKPVAPVGSAERRQLMIVESLRGMIVTRWAKVKNLAPSRDHITRFRGGLPDVKDQGQRPDIL